MKNVFLASASALLGAFTGAAISKIIMEKTVGEKDQKIEKFKTYYNVLNQWLALRHEGKALESYFKSNGYQKIAVYGMGEMGNRLCEELRESDISVEYAVDRNNQGCYSDLDVLSLDESLKPVDAVVVTAVFDFEAIAEELQDKFDCPVVSLEDIIFEL